MNLGNNAIKLHAITSIDNKNMSNGMRNTSGTPLSETEIEFVKSEIRRIEADENVFIFNDPAHLYDSTCYNIDEDKVYVTRNVFPDELYASAHPRDTMSVGAVLAHEYYGHRYYRDEYLSDLKQGKDYHTTPLWKDECRASLTAAQITPGLTEIDKRDLILDAVYRAREAGQLIEMNDFMKEAVYGYKKDERKFTRNIDQPKFVSEASQVGNQTNRDYEYKVSKMQKDSRDYDDLER